MTASRIMSRLRDLEALAHQVSERIVPDVERAADLIAASINAGGKLLICGNGGSAAQAQHLAAELVGRYRKERRALPAIALTTDTSALTALANDYGYDTVFTRQLEALGREGDALLALSTSGRSANVADALGLAREMGIGTIAITGDVELGEPPHVHVRIPSTDTTLIQEATTHLAHTIAEIVEERCA